MLILGAKYLTLLENNTLPGNILIAVALYSFLSALSVPLFDLLSTLQTMKAFLMIETIVVLVQIFIFTLLVSIGQTTFFVSALLAYALSYSFMAFSTLVLIISTGHFTSNLKASFQTLLQLSLLKESIRGVLIILIERMDKLLVPFFYVSPQLAQISIFSGVLNFFRVLPDTSIRLAQKRAINNQVPFKSRRLSSLLQTVVFICIVVLAANFIIYFTLGEEWVLSLPIILLLTVYEVSVWRARILLLDSKFVSDKVSETLNSALILFYLLPLPFLMMKFSYEIALSGLVAVVLLWFAISAKKQKLG